MTAEELDIILTLPPADAVQLLRVTEYKGIPWKELEPQYEPMQHSIMTDLQRYPQVLNEKGVDIFPRTVYALQKIACKRVAQSMFANAAIRNYNYKQNDQSHANAVSAIEDLLTNHVSIDTINVERAKKLCATCQVATIWSTYEGDEYFVGEDSTNIHIKATIYSEDEGYTLYPQYDPNGRLLIMSIAYNIGGNEYLTAYTNTESPKMLHYQMVAGRMEMAEGFPMEILVFPVVYITAKEPAWGGLAGTNLVEQLESMESHDGYYLQENAAPVFGIDYGELPDNATRAEDPKQEVMARKVFDLGKGGKIHAVTWEGMKDASSARFKRIREHFFEQNQIPDTSFANLLGSRTSADNKELVFTDARAAAKDVSGEWVVAFAAEFKILKTFASVMFPKLSEPLKRISCRTEIRPYAVNTDLDNAEMIMRAGDAMSLNTKIRILNKVTDVAQEAAAILEEQKSAANYGI